MDESGVDSVDDGHEEEDDEDEDIRHVNFTPSIPQMPSSQLSLSTLDKTVLSSKNLILEYETDIDKYHRGPAYNKMSKEALAAEEKRKIRLIELETRKLSVYTEMQEDERKARIEFIKKQKLERDAQKQRQKYEEYNKRREQEEKMEAREDSVSKGLLSKVKSSLTSDQANALILDVLTNQQSNMVII